MAPTKYLKKKKKREKKKKKERTFEENVARAYLSSRRRGNPTCSWARK
jgi:hypothetical protein